MRVPFAAGLRASFHMGNWLERALCDAPGSRNTREVRTTVQAKRLNLNELCMCHSFFTANSRVFWRQKPKLAVLEFMTTQSDSSNGASN